MTIAGDEGLLGHTLDGRYLIHERIARGGMASVFRATDTRLDREVAIKVMHRALGDAEEMHARFQHEARASAKLNNRGVVAVYDQGTDGDYTYLVMEYVPGRTLRDVMRDEAPMKPQRALALLEPVLVALSAAHEAKIIHRDVKPENILIDGRSGEIKVADFGLARRVTNATTAHSGGALMGTVSYLAPEVVLQKPADPRSDVYSCGTVLFEMLTGQKPHTADTPIQVAYKHVNEDIPAPSTLVPDLPDYVDALVARATDRDVHRRSPDAHTFLLQLRRVQRALADGLESDEELTADILPGGPTPANRPSIVPADDQTQTIGSGDGEHTVAWSSTAAGMAAASDPDALTGPVLGSMSRVGREPTPAEPLLTDPVLPPPARQRQSRKGAILLLLAVLALVVAAVAGWWFGIGRYTTTPDLLGQTQAEAVRIAEAAELVVEFGPEQFSEDVPPGQVVSTDPAPGDRILPGDTVTVRLSKGPERYEVPDLAGRTLAEAETILGSRNLKVGDTSEAFSETVAKGSVVRAENHDVGDQVKRDTEIDLVLSKGRQPLDVTDFTGKPASEATEKLEEAGFSPKVTEQFSDSVDAGVVISQDPKSGTAFRGDTINLTVSKGPEEIPVPDLRDMTEGQARAALEKVGMKLNATRNPLAGDNAKVRYQTPGAGSKRKRGATISVFLS